MGKKKLLLVIKALNDQETRLIGLKPKDTIKMKSVKQNPAAPAHRPVGKREKKIAENARVRYLYAPGEADNDTRRRATDPIWSIKTFSIKNVMIVENQPVLYYLENGPTRSFVREKLQVVPIYSELPPILF